MENTTITTDLLRLSVRKGQEILVTVDPKCLQFCWWPSAQVQYMCNLRLRVSSLLIEEKCIYKLTALLR